MDAAAVAFAPKIAVSSTFGARDGSVVTLGHGNSNSACLLSRIKSSNLRTSENKRLKHPRFAKISLGSDESIPKCFEALA